MTAISDRLAMIRGMSPRLREGGYVFVTAPASGIALTVLMTFVEDEGMTWIVRQEEADALGLAYELVTRWISLDVNSALAGVGLTAAVSGALAEAGIACNVIAALHHDHLFIPSGDALRALRILGELSAQSE